METIRFQQNLTSFKTAVTSQQAKFSGRNPFFMDYEIPISPNEQLEKIIALRNESPSFLYRSKDPLGKKINQLANLVFDIGTRLKSKSFGSFIYEKIIFPIQNLRSRQVNLARQSYILNAIKNGASPNTVINYEKFPYTSSTEAFFQYAVGAANDEIVHAFFQASPKASHNLIKPPLISDLLGIGLSTQLQSPNNPMDLLFLKEVGVERLSQFNNLTADVSYGSSPHKGSFLFQSVIKLHPAFVNAFAKTEKHLNTAEVEQVLSIVQKQFFQAPEWMKNNANRLNQQYAMVNEEMAIGSQILQLLEKAIDPADETLLSNFKSQQTELIQQRDTIWDATVPKDQREHGPFFRTPLI